MIDAGSVVTATGQDHDLVLTVIEEVRHAGAFVKWTKHHWLCHVSDIPGAPLSLGLFIETRCKQGLVIGPLKALLTRTRVASTLDY